MVLRCIDLRKKEKQKKIILKLIAILAVVLAAALSIYMLFIRKTYISCGVPTEVKEAGRYVRLRIAHNDKITWIKVPASYYSPEDGAYNIERRGTKVVYMKACGLYTGRMLAIDDNYIQTPDTTIALSDKVEYYKASGSTLARAKQSDIVIGCSTCRIVLDSSGNAGAVIIGENEINSIRVGISSSDYSSMKHESLVFYPVTESRLTGFNAAQEEKLNWRYYSGEGMKVTGGDISYILKKYEMLSIDYKDGYMVLSVYSMSSSNKLELKEEIGRTQSRVTVQCLSDPLYIKSLKRSNGYKPTYYGSFEIYIEDSALRLINEVDFEHYLRYVVPAQMVPSGGLESYKAQAVASRTSSIYQILNGNSASEGYHIADNSQAQPYNSQPAIEECNTAIDATKGQIIAYNGSIINAKYYSTSCGTGASYNEVYYKGRKPSGSNSFPYLSYNSYTSPKVTSLKDETTATEFFKDWTIKSYDSNSPYYRWKFSMTRSELLATINANIYSLYTENPKLFREKTYLNIYKSTTIPIEGIGTIKDIEISSRGTAGNVLTLTLTCESGTYRVYGGENIQKLLTPEELTLSLMYGSDTLMESIPSPYFAIDKTTSGSTLKSVTIYGGGYGNGVGMSQYGVIGLVRTEKTYDEVLTTFYPGTELTTIEEMYPTDKE